MSQKKYTPRKVKSKKPMTLSQLKKLAIKRDKTNIIQLNELELIIAQEKTEGTKYTFIFDGTALVNGKYISDFLLSNKSQKKGEMVYLNGVSKSELEDHWSPDTVQVCDGNVLAWDCLDGIMLYIK